MVKRSPLVGPEKPEGEGRSSLADIMKRFQEIGANITFSAQKMWPEIAKTQAALTKSDVALTNPVKEDANEADTTADPSTRRAKEPQDYLPPNNPHAGRGKPRRRRR